MNIIIRVCIFVGVFGGLWAGSYFVVRWIRRNGSIQEINILDKAIVKSQAVEAESVFDKNMDEILYFFEVTRYRVVVIEDLDRFDSTNIFVALRELNNLLNNYEKIKDKVTFIYAIKDDMFEMVGERTKFFDFIIPIVPYVSSTNSGEILRTNLKFDDQTDKSSLYEISGKYISLISPYISDMRDLKSICNEFIIFKNTLKGNQQLDLIDEQLFSLIVFKNLYPKDFAQLEDESEESIVQLAFRNKAKFVSDKQIMIDQKVKEQEEVILKLERESLRDIRDLKIVLLACAMGYKGAVASVIFDGVLHNLEELLKDDFEVNNLKNRSLTVSYIRYGSTYSETITDMEKSVSDNGGDYFDRIDHVKRGIEKCKEDAKKDIESFEREVNELRTYSIAQIIDQFGIAFLDEQVKQNGFLVFLLRNGFLKEDYKDYINYFHPNSISKDEMNFILGIRNHRSVGDYTYPIKNVGQVFTRLQDYEFKQCEALNFNLVDYAIQHQHESTSVDALIKQLSNHSDESMSFIKAYFDRGENIKILLKDLCKANSSLWKDIYNDNGIPVDTRFAYLDALISCADMDDVIAQNGVDDGERDLSTFLTGYPDSVERLKNVDDERLKTLFAGLDIQFTDLTTGNLSEDLKQDIFDNNRYELNEKMLRRVVEWKAPELVNDLFTRNYTTVLRMDYKPLLENVERDFAGYVKRIVLGIDTNTREDIDAVEGLLEKLLPDNLELCIAILKKELVNWENIEDCCQIETVDLKDGRGKIWDYLFSNDRVLCKWNNLSAYFNEYGMTDVLVEYFERNVDMLDSESKDAGETVIEALIDADLTEDTFRKLITRFFSKPYSGLLTSLNEMKIRVLVEESAIPFTVDYWKEMQKSAPAVRVFYFSSNKDLVMSKLSIVDLTESEIGELLLSDNFNSYEKQSILEKIMPTAITLKTAQIIRNLSFSVKKNYAEAAWSLLSDDEKYELLLHQMDCYEDSELSDKFSELASVYHQLVERTKHKYSLPYTDYNKALLEKLLLRSYITSMEELWEEKDNHILFGGKNEKEHLLTGYVRQAKEN